MKINILTIFPEMFEPLRQSMLGRAIDNGILELDVTDIRDYTQDKHNRVDDAPYGGGAGMVMQAQPIYDAYRAVIEKIGHPCPVIYMTPQGKTFKQEMAKDFAEYEELILLCGHYEGVDERVLEEIVTHEVSIGDYVLTGGELPAMVVIDTISRLVPGVLHNDDSANTESFENGLLEYPQYSRPEVWNDKAVPPILLSGDHAKVDAWRLEQSIARTKVKRPDLYQEFIDKQ